VKDQGFCGSCWAFSFASSLESTWFVATGQSVDIPEQFVIDCAWDQGSHACDGGNFDSAAHTIVDRFRGLVPTREFGGLLFQSNAHVLFIVRHSHHQKLSFRAIENLHLR
jgi:hypothetical protein